MKEGKPLDRVYDAHMHLSSTIRKHNNPKILEVALSQGLAGGLDVGSDLSEDRERFTIIQNYPNIYFSTGIYPDGVTKGALEPQLRELEAHIEEFKPVAIGEIGIDFHWNFGTPMEQVELCTRQIEIANSYGLPVIIHNRLGDSAIMEVLKKTPVPQGLMFHCFSSDTTLAEFAIDRGYYISFAGNLTFSNAHGLRKVAGMVPSELLMVETDSPYLTPHPHRGKPNDSSRIMHTIQCMAETRGDSIEAVVGYTGDNFKRFLGLSTDEDRKR